MSRHQLLSFPSDDALAGAVADRWLSDLAARPEAGAPFCAALSGGRIAKKFFETLTRRIGSRRSLFGSVDFFWADERCVPPTDAESNFGLARTHLLAPLEILPDRIHRLRGEIAPERAAAEGEAEICRIAPMNAAGHPVLDLVLLGMGEDGHVASLFPGAPDAVLGCGAVYQPVTASKPPPRRITMNFPTIAAARQVWVLASGTGKTEALRESLSPGGQTPLARVLQSRQNTILFTDIRNESTS